MIVVEQKGVREAITRSIRLSKGKGWLIVRLDVMAILATCPLFVAAWLGWSAAAPALPARIFPLLGYATAEILLMPLIVISSTLLYFELSNKQHTSLIEIA